MYKIYINKTVHIEASGDRLLAPIRGHFPQCKKQAVCTPLTCLNNSKI